jgi:hypothetical protein
VADDAVEAALPGVKAGDRGEPITNVGAATAGVAVRRRVEGHHPVALRPELAHERRELGGAPPPAVDEKDGLRPGSPLVGHDVSSPYRKRAAASRVVNRLLLRPDSQSGSDTTKQRVRQPGGSSRRYAVGDAHSGDLGEQRDGGGARHGTPR